MRTKHSFLYLILQPSYYINSILAVIYLTKLQNLISLTIYFIFNWLYTIYQIVPRHLILQRIVLLIFPKSEQGQLQKNYATGKSKRILFEK